MSRPTCGPTGRGSNYFRQHSDLSSSTSGPLNADVATPGLGQLLSCPPGSLTLPSHSPYLAVLPSQPPASVTSLLPTLPPITLPTPPSLLPALRCAESRMLSLDFTASSSSYDPPPPSPPDLLHPPPTSGPTRACPSFVPPTQSASTPQHHEPTIFAGAHDFIIKDSQFIDISLGRPGIDKLLEHSMPDTFHNSAARYPPPKCHLGTRNDYTAKIIDWALGNSDRHEPTLWMRGPFGVGKSAVAQSCAEALQLQNKLAAALFFSRSNTDRDNPQRVFTSIAYQIATLCGPFSDIVSAHIHRDPSFAMKSLSAQFEELLVHPFSRINIADSGINGHVVIIDGLDECRGTPEQCEIIRVIAASARNRTTPLRWFITSRPEDPIIRAMNSDDVSSVSFHFELPVSRAIDHEILLYLTDEFVKIRRNYRLPHSWPSEEVLALLVDCAAGLWIYVATIIRFIMTENSFGPEDQLRIVLDFAKSVFANARADNPLAEMDLFYTLIMQQVPQRIRTMVRKILLLYSAVDERLEYIAAVLGLSEEQFRRCCSSIQSVMELQGANIKYMQFYFYHTSFLDFLKDPKRSKELCIYGDFLNEYRWELLDWLHQVYSLNTGPLDITFPPELVHLDGWQSKGCYYYRLRYFWDLCSLPSHPLDFRTSLSLKMLPFRTMLRLLGYYTHTISPRRLQQLRQNLPGELRDQIIRGDRCPTPGCTNTKNVWILGYGVSERVVVRTSNGGLWMANSQDLDHGRCFCGSPADMDCDGRYREVWLSR